MERAESRMGEFVANFVQPLSGSGGQIEEKMGIAGHKEGN